MQIIYVGVDKVENKSNGRKCVKCGAFLAFNTTNFCRPCYNSQVSKVFNSLDTRHEAGAFKCYKCGRRFFREQIHKRDSQKRVCPICDRERRLKYAKKYRDAKKLNQDNQGDIQVQDNRCKGL